MDLMCGWMDVMAKSAEANRELQLDHSPAVVYVPERALSAEKTEKKPPRSRENEWRQPSDMTRGSREKKVLERIGPTRRTDPQGHRVGCLLACLRTD